MAEDLKLAGSILKPRIEIGQFWRDTVNTDVLKILGFSFEVETGGKTISGGQLPEAIYVRCACYPRGEYLMGTQEMKSSHLGTERFQKVGFWQSLWYRIKFAILTMP